MVAAPAVVDTDSHTAVVSHIVAVPGTAAAAVVAGTAAAAAPGTAVAAVVAGTVAGIAVPAAVAGSARAVHMSAVAADRTDPAAVAGTVGAVHTSAVAADRTVVPAAVAATDAADKSVGEEDSAVLVRGRVAAFEESELQDTVEWHQSYLGRTRCRQRLCGHPIDRLGQKPQSATWPEHSDRTHCLQR
jgi:hypothetical protein